MGANKSEDIPVSRVKELEANIPPLKFHLFYTVWVATVHIFGILGWIIILKDSLQVGTILYMLVNAFLQGIGTTIAGHRYFSHKSFKAKTPLRILLLLCQTIGVQHSVYQWAARHRAHHKYSETEMDPHNAKRGFWFAHVGWLIWFNPERAEYQEKNLDLKDLESDPLIMLQHRYYLLFALVLGLLLPSAIPCYLFNEVPTYAVLCVFAQLLYVYHVTFLVNSAAHIWGNRPYDKTISPADNKAVSFVGLGEGWHNYHHSFPWDYRCSELGPLYQYNPSALIIDMLAKFGLVYDLKYASPSMISQRMERTGDHAHAHAHAHAA